MLNFEELVLVFRPFAHNFKFMFIFCFFFFVLSIFFSLLLGLNLIEWLKTWFQLRFFFFLVCHDTQWMWLSLLWFFALGNFFWDLLLLCLCKRRFFDHSFLWGWLRFLRVKFINWLDAKHIFYKTVRDVMGIFNLIGWARMKRCRLCGRWRGIKRCFLWRPYWPLLFLWEIGLWFKDLTLRHLFYLFLLFGIVFLKICEPNILRKQIVRRFMVRSDHIFNDNILFRLELLLILNLDDRDLLIGVSLRLRANGMGIRVDW